MNDSQILFYVLSSMGLFLIIAVGIIIFFNRSQLKVNKIKLHEQEMELNFQNELLQNTVRTQEDERRRIASELHDDIASKLNIIHLNLHLLKKGRDLTESDLKIIDQIETSLSVSIERTRSISHELLPQVFKKFGIHHTLKELEHEVNISQTIMMSIESEYLIKISDELKLLHIYRIIQELIQNTLKYAKAKNINLIFKSEDKDMISMQYTDDGIGFDVQKVNSGLGMGNIMTRSKLLDAIVELKSIPEINGMLFKIKFKNHD
jgi:two-component system, NarL family, sensor kinase